MKTITKPVYYCDYCKKKGLSKFAMELHEKWCNANPDNYMKCIGCIHLDAVAVEFTNEHGTMKSNSFKCEVKGIQMYPLKALKKNLPTKYPHDFENKVLMPKQCGMFEDDLPF